MDFKKLYELLSEAPINHFELKGGWDKKDPKYGFDKASIGILTSDKGVEKIKKMWSKLPYDVDMYMVRNKDAKNHAEVGEVDEEYIKKYLKVDVPINYDNITIFYTQNLASEKIPTTAWTLAHRLGHAMRRKNGIIDRFVDTHFFRAIERTLEDLVDMTFEEVYGIPPKSPYATDPKNRLKIKLALGTFKSARDKLITRPQEFIFELIAQYIVQGGVKFNYKLPSILEKQVYRNKIFMHPKINFDGPEGENFEKTVFSNSNTIDYYIDELLGNAVGKIYVM